MIINKPNANKINMMNQHSRIKNFTIQSTLMLNENNIKKDTEIREKLSVNYPLKQKYNITIPLNIFQTWHTKKLTLSMFHSMLMIKNNNPGFNYTLFDDNDCRQFIIKNFNNDVLNAYDSLIPGAYKADLWRYCILYKKGGIYLDIKYYPVNDFKFISLTEKEHWVLDSDSNGIYNALMVVKPENEILRKAIDKIVQNVKNRFYGSNCLEPTGPKLLSNFFSDEEKNNFDMKHEYYFGDINNRVINLDNIPVLKSYNGYINEYNNTKKTEHYSILWSRKNIYK